MTKMHKKKTDLIQGKGLGGWSTTACNIIMLTLLVLLLIVLYVMLTNFINSTIKKRYLRCH